MAGGKTAAFTEADLIKELADLSRPGTDIRTKFNKWGAIESPGSLTSSRPYDIRPERGVEYGFAQSWKPDTLIGFPLSSLSARLRIKRGAEVFAGISTLWKMINPFGRKGLGKTVYKHVLITLYIDVLRASENVPTFTKLLSEYIRLDFDCKSALNFSDFYSRIFTCIDTSTKSKLVNEYVRLLSKLAETVNESRWLQTQNLHLHIDPGEGKAYEQWMRPYVLQSQVAFDAGNYRFRDTPEPQSMRKVASTTAIPPKELPLLRTSLRHIDQLLKSQPRKRRARASPHLSSQSIYFKSSPGRWEQEGTQKNINRFKYLEHLESISPLSTLPRPLPMRRDLVEEVVHVRASHSSRLYPGTQTTIETAR